VTERVPPERYPRWVRFSLLGASNRASQWFWVVASVVAGAMLLIFARNDPGPGKIVYLFAGLWGFGAAGLYFATIRWMDKHGTWPQ
jgi:bacteriorhodopsin